MLSSRSSARTTALNPQRLTAPQAAVARWISQRYRVAAEPVARLVQEAWLIGRDLGLDPTLLLAVVALVLRPGNR